MSADNKITLLLVDDEPNNVQIIQNDLEDENFNVLTAENGAVGWDLLLEHQSDIKVILLDRMMPVMNGMEFMAKLRNESGLAHIPVIMQTAASDKQQIIEGIEAGVYYYLTKPYQQEMLLAVLRSALSESDQVTTIKRELYQFKSTLNLVQQSQFLIKNMADARHLSAFLASHYDDSDRVTLGIWEMLINAVEHGSAGIGYREKSELLLSGTWEKEVERRLALPENVDKEIHVYFERKENALHLRVTDEGQGFDWKKYLNIDPMRATDSHGRGVALSVMMSFDEVEYNEKGNSVTCIVNI